MGSSLRRALLLAWPLLLACGCRASRAPDGADFAIPSCLAPVDRILVTDDGGWAEQVAGIPGLRPGQVLPVTPDADGASVPVGMMTPWTTDQWVFGYCGGRRVAMELPGERGLVEWGRKHLRAEGWPVFPLGTSREYPESRFDAGGNVLAIPAIPARGLPAVIITSAQVQPAIKNFLRRSSAGRLIELDTGWLKVGHVDEIVGVLPGGRAGFRLAMPDPEAGLKLLEGLPGDCVLFGPADGKVLRGRVSASAIRFIEDRDRDLGGGKWKYVRILSGPSAGLVGRVFKVEPHRLIIDRSWNLRCESPTVAVRAARDGRVDEMPIWFDAPAKDSEFLAVEDSRLWQDGAGEEYPAFVTAGELRRDPVLRDATEGVAKRLYGPGGLKERLCRELGLDDADIVRLPMLFSADPDGGRAVALIPNPVNLVVLNRQVVMLKPFGPRSDPAKESSDVFEAAWSSALQRVQLTPVFLDGWDELHRQDGGAHCGMNALRFPQ